MRGCRNAPTVFYVIKRKIDILALAMTTGFYMRKILIFSAIFYSSLSLSVGVVEPTNLIGSWRNQLCQPTADGQYFTAYHIQFSASGQLMTYFQSYDTSTCDGEGGTVSQQLYGLYEILHHTEKNAQTYYEVSLHHPRLSYLRAQRVIIQGDTLQLCPSSSSARCASFNRAFAYSASF